jgi:DNA replication and repair protein RecF
MLQSLNLQKIIGADMFLEKLILTNFKNYLSAEFEFSEKINYFIGDNGVGKTNILDAIYYLAFTKSFINNIDSQNINHDEQFFLVQGSFKLGGSNSEVIQCLQKRNQKKEFKRNKKEYDRMSDHIGFLPLVMVSPSDSNLIHYGSDERRKFIDVVISQFDKPYLDNLISYNKSLAQRNALLKQFAQSRYFDKQALEIWDDQIITLGAEIYQARNEFIESFIPLFNKYFRIITSGKEEVSLSYESQINTTSLEVLIKNSVEKDCATQYTNCGIHKDDIIFNIQGLPVKKFGSQGQQKSFMVAIKLAQFEYTKNIKGYKPILLFDDIFDKLDNNRVEQIIELVSENIFGQVFITDTQKERIDHVISELNASYKIFGITYGSAAELFNNENK